MTVLWRTRISVLTVFANPWWSCGGTSDGVDCVRKPVVVVWWHGDFFDFLGGVAEWTVFANPWWSCGGTVVFFGFRRRAQRVLGVGGRGAGVTAGRGRSAWWSAHMIVGDEESAHHELAAKSAHHELAAEIAHDRW
ncbi:hypothetical protein T492DRAFT_1152008 [Pavlovales sp. CCMP2436]|nr:hypothetical protein T492DRAFT_1152008 [Pavlovales sp. CCMP2436]